MLLSKVSPPCFPLHRFTWAVKTHHHWLPLSEGNLGKDFWQGPYKHHLYRNLHQILFFAGKQGTWVVFWLGAITAKEEKEEEKKEAENSVPEVPAVTELGCKPLSDRFGIQPPRWSLKPWCGWAGYFLSLPSIKFSGHACLCTSASYHRIPKGWIWPAWAWTFTSQETKCLCPPTGRNAVLQSQVTAWAQAAPAEKAAWRDMEKGSTEIGPLPPSLPASRCPYGSPAFPQLCRHPPVTVICNLSLYTQNWFCGYVLRISKPFPYPSPLIYPAFTQVFVLPDFYLHLFLCRLLTFFPSKRLLTLQK